MSDDTAYFVATLVKILVVFVLAVHVVPILVYLERRISAWIQLRIGPNRVGPLGLFQPLADLVKFLGKEDFVPAQANKVLFWIAPVLAAVPPFLVMALIPLAPPLTVAGRQMPAVVVDSPVALLLVFALSSLAVYGIAIGGWASNSKYSLLGGLRSSAQMISYELSLGVAVLSVVCVAGTLDLQEIIQRQTHFFGFDGAGRWAGWNIFSQPVAFLVFLVASYAETNRLPFDLPEAESELVGGYHTEYSATKFSLFFMGEYVAMLAMSCLIVLLWFGGWHFPGIDSLGLSPNQKAVVGLLAFMIKVGFFLLLYIQVRWTLPRFRYDQLMRLGWKVLLPIALVNVLVTGFVVSWS